MKKEAKVIRLPTDNPSNIYQHNVMTDLNYHPTLEDAPPYNHKFQHLYLTSDEEIKEGDWCLSVKDSMDMMTDEFMQQLSPFKAIRDLGVTENTAKIIATTDRSLLIQNYNSQDGSATYTVDLPQIPQSFIEAYVKAEGKIDKVMVEYKCGRCSMVDGHKLSCKDKHLWVYVLKTREDNTVVIHKCKTETSADILNIASCMLSIYDSLKLEDNNSRDNSESLTEVMFRKMKAYNIDLNELLNFTHLKPIESKVKEDMYSRDDMKSKIQNFRLYSLKFGLEANVTNKWIEDNV